MIDPVMHVQFSKAFAVATKEHKGHTYFLYTQESLHAFEKPVQVHDEQPE